ASTARTSHTGSCACAIAPAGPRDFKAGDLGRGVDAEAAYRSIRSIAQEAVSEEELRALVQEAVQAKAAGGGAKAPRAYIGFEPSGTAHIGWMVCTDAIRRLTAAGFDVTVLLADWHAQINDKLGGDLAAIQRCGRYMEEAFAALGVAEGSVTYRYANELAADSAYWATVVRVAKHSTLARIRRAMTILGRGEDEADGDLSKFLYPAMQVADIFHMGIHLAMGGMDQRHAHMLARDVAPKLGRPAPVALHTPLVPSLKGPGGGRMEAGDGVRTPEGAAKMSKSDPDSGIFIHDAPDEIKRKLRLAHCPPKEVEGNPVLDLLRLVVWPRLAELHKDGPARFEIRRPEKFGGSKYYVGYEALLAEYRSGALHPMDLKNGVADALALLLQPVRAYFGRHPDNWQFVQGLRKTR
ncbi:MAG TPA: tyrosine--tRNA ligase, partial [Candidatus Thermoplasmatota archaeon]|nr:tyrosine--tRNA ligase [Candidatus Thermoplasmatota archaeon]